MRRPSYPMPRRFHELDRMFMICIMLVGEYFPWCICKMLVGEYFPWYRKFEFEYYTIYCPLWYLIPLYFIFYIIFIFSRNIILKSFSEIPNRLRPFILKAKLKWVPNNIDNYYFTHRSQPNQLNICFFG